MLRAVILRFGADETEEPLEFAPGPMTVFVGPNNSGKSLALREIEGFLDDGGASERLIVARIDPVLPSQEDAARMLLDRAAHNPAVPPPEGTLRVLRMNPASEHTRKRSTDVDDLPEERLIDLQAVLDVIEGEDERTPEAAGLLCRDFLALFTIRLDGQTRLALTHPRPTSDLESYPSNHLGALFRHEGARERIREITVDAFGLYFVIDRTTGKQLRIRMSERAPMDLGEEQLSDARAVAFHSRAADIAELSDGVKAFTGLTAAVLSADYRIMLIDEPEAFLHPPLTRKLGRRLTQLAAERDANVLASTHSPDFVMGCIQSGKRVNIVRLTHKKGVASARLLSADKLETMMRDPLLRSTGVLGALFHDGAVVCEADADRVFYQEINERLLSSRTGGADGCVFLNAQNKQTIRRILRPLREMGIPAVAIVDLDILKGREDFRDLLKAAFVPQALREGWEEVRNRIHQKLRNEEFKEGGIYTLGKELRPAAHVLLDNLAEYGIFVVPGGELEGWLPELEVGGHGPEWLTQVFHRMGTDSTQPGYLHSGTSGVWRFVHLAAIWLADPRRRGMAEEVIPLDHLLPPPEEADEAEVTPGEPSSTVAA